MIDELKKIAYDAWEIHRKYFNKHLEVSFKWKDDPVTNADKECQDFLEVELKKLVPWSCFLWEESSMHSFDSSKVTWIVDPLDWTKNFMQWLSQFWLSIGLRKNKMVEIGMIYLPIRDELFYASAWWWAFKISSWKKQRIYNYYNSEYEIEWSVSISKEFKSSFLWDKWSNTIKNLNTHKFLQLKWSWGSVCYTWCMIADWSNDVSIRLHDRLHKRDTVALEAILVEAWCVIVDIDLQSLDYSQKNTNRINGVLMWNKNQLKEITNILWR